jgi:hypothetical protein
MAGLVIVNKTDGGIVVRCFIFILFLGLSEHAEFGSRSYDLKVETISRTPAKLVIFSVIEFPHSPSSDCSRFSCKKHL